MQACFIAGVPCQRPSNCSTSRSFQKGWGRTPATPLPGRRGSSRGREAVGPTFNLKFRNPPFPLSCARFLCNQGYPRNSLTGVSAGPRFSSELELVVRSGNHSVSVSVTFVCPLSCFTSQRWGPEPGLRTASTKESGLQRLSLARLARSSRGSETRLVCL